MNGPLTVVCVKAGMKFGPEYVNRLHLAVKRYLTQPHRFACLTENASGIDAEIQILPLEHPDLVGWWHKLTLFKPPAGLEDSRLLFLDLDKVIIGNIDFLAEYDGPFAILRDFYRPKGYGSAIMSIAPGFGRHIWERFSSDPRHWMAAYSGDQEFIESCGVIADLWQDLYPKKIVSYKAHCQVMSDEIPGGASIVCFHGEPRPHEAAARTLWVKTFWEGNVHSADTIPPG